MPSADDIAYKVQKWTKQFLKDVDDKGVESEPYFDSDRTFERGGIVPVNKVIVAANLMAARWIFETWPAILKTQIEGFVGKVTSSVVLKKAAKESLKGVPGAGQVGALIADSVQSMIGDVDAANIEKLIREMSANVRRELNESVLRRDKGTRKTRDVRTRHKGKPRPAKVAVGRGKRGPDKKRRKRRKLAVRAVYPQPTF